LAFCLLICLLSPPALAAQDVDRGEGSMQQALIRAARAGRPALLQQALTAGADPNRPTEDGVSPLELVIRAGESESVGILLDAGAHCPRPGVAGGGGLRDVRGEPVPEGALAIAAAAGRRDLLLQLLGRCEQEDGAPEGEPAEGVRGWTALQWAASRGHGEIIQALTSVGFRLDAGHARDETPLALAFRQGHLAAAQALVEAGADVRVSVDGRVTPLHAATDAQLVSLAAGIFRAGADVEAVGEDGRTPIQVAFDRGEDELLQAYYCVASPSFKERHGDRLASSALAWGDSAIADFFASPACEPDRISGLLEAGIRREAMTDAARRGAASEVARHLDEGAAVDSRDRHGATAMLLAASSGDQETVRLLATRGADCSALGRIYDGNVGAGWGSVLSLGGQWIGAPLARASMRGHLDVVRYLVENCGVPVDEREWDSAEDQQIGWTPLQRAASEGHAEIVDYLLKQQADVEGDGHRTPPVMLAARKGLLDIVHVLLDAGARVDHAFRLETSLLYLAAVAEETLLRQAYCASPAPFRDRHEAELRDVVRAEGDAHFLLFLDDPTCEPEALADLVRAHTRLRIAGDRYRDGRFAEMEEHAQVALDVRGRILGADHPDVAEALNTLAVARLYRGDYSSALGLHERALEIRRGAFAADDPRVAISLNNLGFAYAAMGDHDRALPLYEESLAMRERASVGTAEDLDRIGTALSNLSDLHVALGDFRSALPLQERALSMRRRSAAQGIVDNSALVYESLLDLANIRSSLGDHDVARRLGEEALDALGTLGEHADVVKATSTVAGIRFRAGDLVEALSLYESSLAMRSRVYGDAHPTVAPDAAGAARVAFGLGLDDLAVQHTLHGASTLSRTLLELLPTLSVAEQAALLDRDVPLYADLISRLAERAEFHEGYGYLLGWKGALLRGMRSQRQFDGLLSDSRLGGEAAALQEVRAALGAWFYQAGRIPLADWRARNDSLSLRKERLERSLASATAETEPAMDVADSGLEALRQALLGDEALVDLYRLGDPDDPTRDRYAAVVTGQTAYPRYVELGPAGPIDEDIASWLDRVDRLREDGEIWSVLEEDLWQPVRSALPPGVGRVWISPDAALARLPWHLFSESHQFALIGSATELTELRRSQRQSAGAGRSTVVALGDVDFDAASRADAARHPEDYLPPLPGTADEVIRIAELGENAGFPVRTLTGDAATTEALTSALADADYAHLATHGFFFEASREETGNVARADLSPPDATLSPDGRAVGGGRNPLVETGLALAGASRRDPSSFRPLGRLTAEELVSLDLSSLKLVTLSACDTGRGREVTGQGVIGLQSAFSAAGARSVLMSLWKVDDESTALLMSAFYRGLWEDGLTPETALRRAQAAVRDHPSGVFVAPAFWAAWTLAGEAW
jgi:CHAT domain-containing protein/ankyrin repeat protein